MIRISTIFIAICMVLIAASLGLALHALLGLSRIEAAIVALAALSFLILYNAVSMRLRDRSDVGGQIADLSRGTADLARQVGEFGRRLAALETRMAGIGNLGAERIQTALNEINDLGGIVKQLAISVAAHDDALSAREDAPPERGSASDIEWTDHEETPAIADATLAPRDAPVTIPAPLQATAIPAPAASSIDTIVPIVRKALDANQIEIFLQPIVTLPQRKVRFYEAMARVRNDNGDLLAGSDFIAAAESARLMARIDISVVFRCVQVLRRLMVRAKDVGVFCNMSAATLGDAESFTQCLDFLEANRALAPSFILEFKHATFRSLSPVQNEHLAKLAQSGFRFSIDNVSDLRFDARDLADRGVRYIKVPGALLLDPKQSGSDIHAADLSDLLGRAGIDLIAERIEGERAVVDLLDYDVRFGQGFLFSEPKPLRPEAQPSAVAAPAEPRPLSPAAEPARAVGNAFLARRIARPN